MCINCGDKPALPGNKTVPLCAQCQQLATGKERGVKMAPKSPKSGKKLSAVR
jgi:hypothetical protein